MLNQFFIFYLLDHLRNDEFSCKSCYLHGLGSAVLLHVWYKIINFIKFAFSKLNSILIALMKKQIEIY
jgi:hypothetical protein